MQGAQLGQASELDGKTLRIGVVRSRFNDPITSKLEHICLTELAFLGVATQNITCLCVPGALGLPFTLQCMARHGAYNALIALGCVIRGETYHFEIVCNHSSAGLMRVTLDHCIPVANAILTVDNEAQAWARVDEKGRSAARLAVEMATLKTIVE